MGSSIQHIKAGKLKALAVTTATRAADLPDVPALRVPARYDQQVRGAALRAIQGFTPTIIVERVNRRKSPPAPPTPRSRRASRSGRTGARDSRIAAFGKIIADDTEKCGEGHPVRGTRRH